MGVIPARGGSKGLPGKNIRPLAGQPLIAYSIAAALSAAVFDRVIVSTDDEGIADVARRYGADVPFRRPPELATDDTLVFPVLTHALHWLAQHRSYTPDYVMLLQPTSPLRTGDDIQAAVTLAMTRAADAVVSVTAVRQHPYWMKRLTEDGRLHDLVSDVPLRRQELPPVYALNGAIYLVRRDVLTERQTFYTDRTYAYIMPPERSAEIDSAWDLHVAELILRERIGAGRGPDSGS